MVKYPWRNGNKKGKEKRNDRFTREAQDQKQMNQIRESRCNKKYEKVVSSKEVDEGRVENDWLRG